MRAQRDEEKQAAVAVSAPSSAGTLVSWFPLRYSVFNAVRPPSSAGTLVSLFPLSSYLVSAVSPPKASGTSPVKSLFWS